MKPMEVHSLGFKVRRKCLVLAIGEAIVLFFVGSVLLGCGDARKHEAASPAPVANDCLPLTLAELNVWYAEPPVGQNAATFYCQGFDALQLANAGSSYLPIFGKG